MLPSSAIATWFVADDADTATFFPQVGSRSDAPETQAVYWRCTAAFFASSLAVNPEARHLFFTNTRVPVIDGVDLAKLFVQWGVAVIDLPISYRLPKGAVCSWGNQFYIFDVLDWFAAVAPAERLIVLDSDCLWLKPVDEMAAAIDVHGALTYELGTDEHPAGEPINGLSRAGMAQFLARHGGPERAETPYFGGEIYAATLTATKAVAARARLWWPAVLAQADVAPREEAHLLSVIYAAEGIAAGTGNRFIRRMWTTFQHHNLRGADQDLAIWHLPAEKKTGFADLFAKLAADPAGFKAPNFEATAHIMGWPRRRPRKFIRDLALKLREKFWARTA